MTDNRLPCRSDLGYRARSRAFELTLNELFIKVFIKNAERERESIPAVRGAKVRASVSLNYYCGHKTIMQRSELCSHEKPSFL